MLNEILETAGVEIKYGAGDEVNICCPFCTARGETEDRRFRLGINTATGEAQCFNCGWKARGLTYTAKELCRIYKIPIRIVRQHQGRKKKKKVSSTPAKVAGLPEEYESFGANDDFVGRAARRYLTSRGISTLQVVKHKIGYAGAGEFAWRIIFPFIDSEGRIHGCAARAIRPGMTPKYLNTRGMKILWNALPTARTAVLVEGVIDALHVETALLRERNMIAVARLGSSVSGSQMDQLKEYEQVIVFPDHDRAGISGAIELCSRCADRGILTKVIVPQILDGKDPGNMTEEDIIDEVRNALPWRKSAEFRLRAVTRKETYSGITGDLVG